MQFCEGSNKQKRDNPTSHLLLLQVAKLSFLLVYHFKASSQLGPKPN